jgi:hypothetical protein
LPAWQSTGSANFTCREMFQSDPLPLDIRYDRLLAVETGTCGVLLSLTYGG